MTDDHEMITLAMICPGCERELLLTIPLGAVHVEWTVTCPDCIPLDYDGAPSSPDR